MAYRNTIQRDLVLEAVGRLAHPTADEIYQAAVQVHPAISRGTVYRNLGLLVEQGRLRKVSLPGGPDHYDTTLAEHYHISCRGCGKVIDADLPYQQDLIGLVGNPQGFLIDGHDIMLRGLCAECSAQAEGAQTMIG